MLEEIDHPRNVNYLSFEKCMCFPCELIGGFVFMALHTQPQIAYSLHPRNTTDSQTFKFLRKMELVLHLISVSLMNDSTL